MKRHGNLWPQIITFENLLLAARKAQKNKRFTQPVLEFNENLERNLIQLQTELQEQTYKPGEYRHFYVYDPKKRLISAAPYRDRVVHHALCNKISPLLERSFIDTSYANRIGYGSHRAIQKFKSFSRTYDYILQCDIRKFFPSINHQVLKTIICHKIKCQKTLWLVNLIIDHGQVLEPIIHYFPGDSLLTPVLLPSGLPIGNLTSQLFANVYLNSFDHFIQEDLKISAYIRYADDFALFSNEHQELTLVRPKLEAYLAKLRLKMHPVKSQLYKTNKGTHFLGFRILPTQIRLRSDSLKRLRAKIKQRAKDYRFKKIDLVTLEQSIQSWKAHLSHGNTRQLQHNLFDRFTVK